MKITSEHPLPSGPEKGAEPTLSQGPPLGRSWNSPSGLWQRKTTGIAALSVAVILAHLVLRFGFHANPGAYQIPLLATLALGGLPLLYELLRKLLKREFGSDLLGGISIITSILLGEYLAGSIIVLMLSTSSCRTFSPEDKLAIVRKETAAVTSRSQLGAQQVAGLLAS